jgi:hypothetical protein
VVAAPFETPIPTATNPPMVPSPIAVAVPAVDPVEAAVDSPWPDTADDPAETPVTAATGWLWPDTAALPADDPTALATDPPTAPTPLAVAALAAVA